MRHASWRLMQEGTALVTCNTSYGSVIGADCCLCLAKKCSCFLHCRHMGALLCTATCAAEGGFARFDGLPATKLALMDRCLAHKDIDRQASSTE